MEDITIIFLTLNLLPRGWQEYHKSVLLEAIGKCPLITISKEPLDWGYNIIQTEKPSIENIYFQMLRGARIATTPYVAIVEDDTLYEKEHFLFRPPLTEVAYNLNRWGLFTWRPKWFFYKSRPANGSMIAPRELLIQSLSAGPRTIEIRRDRFIPYFTKAPVVFLNHIYAHELLQRRMRKKPTDILIKELPFWGSTKQVVSKFA